MRKKEKSCQSSQNHVEIKNESEAQMRGSYKSLFTVLLCLSAPALADDYLVLTCRLPQVVQGVTAMEVYGDHESWPNLASGQGVSAQGSAKLHLTTGKVGIAKGTFMSDSYGITFTMMMPKRTYALFDFHLHAQNQQIHVTNRWNGVWEDFDMTCSTP